MAFRYKIELNGVELTDVAIGVTTIDKFEEPLDEAGLHLPFTARDYEYEMRGLLSIHVTDGTDDLQFDYLIMSDEVTPGSKYGEWKHDLSVMEYTHKLDMYLIHSLVKTKDIKEEEQAPFLFVGDTYFSSGQSNATDDDYAINMGFKLETLDVKARYNDEETVFLPQVEEAYVAGTLDSGTLYNLLREEVYVKANAISYDTDDEIIIGAVEHAREVISDDDVEWTFDKGDYIIEYGFYSSVAEVDIPVYQYVINVIEKSDNSVYSLVNLVRDVISKFGGIESKLNYDGTRIFDIDPTIVDELKAIEAPQTFIQKATARQVLNGIFQYINAISRLRHQEDDNDLLTIDKFNETSGAFTLEDLSHYTSNQDAQNLANKGINWLEQALPNNLDEPTLKSPAQDNYKTVRSTNIQILENQFELKLEKPIYQLKKLEVVIPEIVFGDAEATPTAFLEYEDFVLDLTSRVINKEEWDLKLTTANFPTMVLARMFEETIGLRNNKVGNLYWRQGDTSIKLADPYGDVVQINLVYNVIREAINEYFTRNMIDPNIYDVMGVDYMQTQYAFVQDLGSDFKYLRFNVEYITLENMNAQVEREDISYSDYYTEARINQSSKLLNVVNATRKSYGELQRSGVPNITFSRHHESIADLLDVGYKNENGYVVVQRKVEWQNNYIYATYSATKDHNRLSQFIGLDQAYRWAEIPTSNQVYECIESYTDYIIISDPDTTITAGDTKHYSTNALEIIFGTLMNDWGSTDGKTKVTLAYVRTDGFLDIYPNDGTYDYGIMTPVASFGVKGGFVFNFGFENNQIAGVKVVESVSDGTLYWNDAVRYTNRQGTFNEFWFQLATTFASILTGWTDDEKSDNYPLIRSSSSTAFGGTSNTLFMCGNMIPAHATYDALVRYKDRSQSFKVSYQNTVISNTYLEYVFGQAFYSENFIVKNPKQVYNEVVGTPMYLYVYEDGTTYGKFEDLKVKSGYETPVLLVETTNVTFSSRQFRFTGSIDLSEATSWAIGDEDGNLYIACNDNHNGFNVSEQHLRPGLLEIGKTE